MARFKGSAPKNARTMYLSKDPRELCKELCKGAGTPSRFPATLGAHAHAPARGVLPMFACVSESFKTSYHACTGSHRGRVVCGHTTW